ncbi:MAG: ABC transporter permease [Peptococcaceae bacterium]|nr:ABC transporter permease [Peptococcaceae bacterium]
MKKILISLIGLILPCLLLGVWLLADRAHWIDPSLFPSPQGVWRMIREMWADGSLGRHVSASFFRLIWGFALALSVAAPLGFFVGQSKVLRRLLMPTLAFFQQIPPIAWIPFFIIWMGFDEMTKVSVIAYSAFVPLFLNTVQGVQSLDPLLQETAHAFKLSWWQRVWWAHLPSAAGPLFVGIRLGLSNSWRALVGAELIAASSGMGALIAEGRQFSQPAKIVMGIFMIGLAGALLDMLLRRLERYLVPWQGSE